MWLFYELVIPIFLAFCKSVSINATPLKSSSPYVVKDNHPILIGWQKVNRAPRDAQCHLQIGLKHGEFEALERNLYEVSDPDHHRYGHHLSAVEVEDLMKPTTETEDLVTAWLSDHGIGNVTYSPSRYWITIQLPIHSIETLLDTEYFVYQHDDDGLTAIRSSAWSLPHHLHDHIEAIHPTNAFINTKTKTHRLRSRSEVQPLGLGENGAPSYNELVAIDHTQFGHMEIPDIKDLPKNPSPSQACNRVATSPVCLRTLYGALDYVPQLPAKNRIGVVNFLDHISSVSDIGTFLQRYRPDAVSAGYEIQTENVPRTSDSFTHDQAAASVSLEANLDTEVILGMASPVPITAYNVGGSAPAFQNSQSAEENTNEPYLEWLQYMLAQPELPQVISISYADEEQTVPRWYAKRVCQGFAQLGARGVSVLVASGDEGVGADGMCFNNDGSNKPMFLPKFPASCPYVTTVGGTRGWDPELVAFDARATFVTGGGFSNYFSRPSFQKGVVDDYVNGLGSLYDGLYNRNGRGYPDISLRAYHYIVVSNGSSTIFDGTSASTPGAAAIFSLVNDALISEGRPALGWLNPWIYSKASKAFKDVVAGSNTGCNTAGFPAKIGWDAATGFGTPWFPTLKALAEERRFRNTKPWYMSFW
ncbi:subtilisin-like protein [Mollisia scopiformis]|uniref:tripeptidyl-peptidase II n=1 Tax=Mollisia scopiformis TaxID=149040 RepID=A0A194XJ31_MOLSC|nr:subtilisin-like protein [Mollisia scopiformis]KUJ19762.1 subtilisin-like protein [Mollisia scopiformis]